MSILLGYILSKQKINLFNTITFILMLAFGIFHLIGITSEYGQIQYHTTESDLSHVELFTENQYWYNVLEISSPDYIYQNAAIDFEDYGNVVKVNNEIQENITFDKSQYNTFVFKSIPNK